MTLNWGAATSNTTALALAPTMPVVAYKVVCVSAVASENIDTVEAINMITTAEAGLVMDWTVGATDVTLTSLKPSTTYTCNVAARDEAGNEVAYVAASQGTSGDATTASKDAKTELNK